MSWFIRISRFGSVHMVKSQDKKFSCAMASICMVNFKVKKGAILIGMGAAAAISSVPIPGSSVVGNAVLDMAMDFAVKSEPEVYAIYVKHKGSAHDFDMGGADGTLYAKILADLGLGEWERVNVGEGGVAQAAADAVKNGVPAMLSVTWNSGERHAVVVDETHGFLGSDYLCIEDPWDGELRIITGNKHGATSYNAGDRPVSLTIWGDKRDYARGSVGRFNGWITRKKA